MTKRVKENEALCKGKVCAEWQHFLLLKYFIYVWGRLICLNVKTIPYFDEKELVGRLREGDEAAFDILYDRYSTRLTGNLMTLLKSAELAEEILQDLFMKVWETREQIDPDKSFRSYIFKIAQNMVYQTFRESARQKRFEGHLSSNSSELYSHIEENIAFKELHQIHQDAIDQLPAKRREVYILFKIEGKSYAEISELLNISTSTINDHLQKANKFLKVKLKANGGYTILIFLITSAL